MGRGIGIEGERQNRNGIEERREGGSEVCDGEERSQRDGGRERG